MTVLYFRIGAPLAMDREAILCPRGISVLTMMPSSGITVPAATGCRATTILSAGSRRMTGLFSADIAVTPRLFYIYSRSFSMWASMRFISSAVMGSVGWQTRLSTKPSLLMAYLVEAVWLLAMG